MATTAFRALLPNMNTPDEPEIASINYDEQTQILHVHLADFAGLPNWTTQYNGVPAHLYQALVQAASPHDYLETELADYKSMSYMPLRSSRTQAEKQQFIAETIAHKKDAPEF